MKLRFKVFLFGGLVSVLLGCSQEETLKPEVIRPVKLMELHITNKKHLSFPGEVAASEEAQLAFRVPGQILKYYVNSGEMVKKGTLLVELDPADYQKKLQAALANYELSKVEHARNEVLIKDSLISQQDFDTTKSQMQVAESAYKNAKANLSYTKIYMPYDGIIANRYRENFESAAAQEMVLSIQSDTTIDVVIDIPERLISQLRKYYTKGASPTIIFPVQIDERYPATLKDISTVADKSTGSYEVTFTLPKPDGINLYSGMAATANITLDLASKDLVKEIPEVAFIRTETETYIWKYMPQEQRVSKVSVPKGQERSLLSQLNDGDKIVIAGVKELNENSRVKPWYKERGL